MLTPHWKNTTTSLMKRNASTISYKVLIALNYLLLSMSYKPQNASLIISFRQQNFCHKLLMIISKTTTLPIEGYHHPTSAQGKAQEEVIPIMDKEGDGAMVEEGVEDMEDGVKRVNTYHNTSGRTDSKVSIHNPPNYIDV